MGRETTEGNDMTYDGPVPIPGTLKSRLKHWFVRATMADAMRLWF